MGVKAQAGAQEGARCTGGEAAAGRRQGRDGNTHATTESAATTSTPPVYHAAFTHLGQQQAGGVVILVGEGSGRWRGGGEGSGG